MPRRPKPAKAKARAKPSRPAPTREGGRVYELEKRLAEALSREAEASKRAAEALGKLQTRDRELAEALEQQTATSDILRAISSSPADVDPVFGAIVENAGRLCDSVYCVVYRFDGVLVHVAAHRN